MCGRSHRREPAQADIFPKSGLLKGAFRCGLNKYQSNAYCTSACRSSGRAQSYFHLKHGRFITYYHCTCSNDIRRSKQAHYLRQLEKYCVDLDDTTLVLGLGTDDYILVAIWSTVWNLCHISDPILLWRRSVLSEWFSS